MNIASSVGTHFNRNLANLPRDNRSTKRGNVPTDASGLAVPKSFPQFRTRRSVVAGGNGPETVHAVRGRSRQVVGRHGHRLGSQRV